MQRGMSGGAARPGWGGLARRVRCAGARQEPDQPRTISCSARCSTRGSGLGSEPSASATRTFYARSRRMQENFLKCRTRKRIGFGESKYHRISRCASCASRRSEVLRPWLVGLTRECAGGEGGIRTLEALARLTVFETARFSHSRTSPGAVYTTYSVGRKCKGGMYPESATELPARGFRSRSFRPVAPRRETPWGSRRRARHGTLDHDRRTPSPTSTSWRGRE